MCRSIFLQRDLNFEELSQDFFTSFVYVLRQKSFFNIHIWCYIVMLEKVSSKVECDFGFKKSLQTRKTINNFLWTWAIDFFMFLFHIFSKYYLRYWISFESFFSKLWPWDNCYWFCYIPYYYKVNFTYFNIMKGFHFFLDSFFGIEIVWQSDHRFGKFF